MLLKVIPKSVCRVDSRAVALRVLWVAAWILFQAVPQGGVAQDKAVLDKGAAKQPVPLQHAWETDPILVISGERCYRSGLSSSI